MTGRLVVCRLAAALALALALVACGRDVPPLDRLPVGGDFELTDHRNQTWRLSAHQQHPALLFFGFTSCPDVCPATMSRLSAAYEKLPAGAVEVLFVSVDPRRDTPGRLADYLAGYPFPATGLTGSVEQIRAVVGRYAASFRAAEGNGGFDHSTRVYLLDTDGQVRFLFSADDDPATIAAVVRQLL